MMRARARIRDVLIINTLINHCVAYTMREILFHARVDANGVRVQANLFIIHTDTRVIGYVCASLVLFFFRVIILFMCSYAFPLCIFITLRTTCVCVFFIIRNLSRRFYRKQHTTGSSSYRDIVAIAGAARNFFLKKLSEH